MNSLHSGQTILHYRILDKIGQGGMGEVYQAEDLKLGRHVAIKRLPIEATQDQQARHRFLREARNGSAHGNFINHACTDRFICRNQNHSRLWRQLVGRIHAQTEPSLSGSACEKAACRRLGLSSD